MSGYSRCNVGRCDAHEAITSARVVALPECSTLWPDVGGRARAYCRFGDNKEGLNSPAAFTQDYEQCIEGRCGDDASFSAAVREDWRMLRINVTLIVYSTARSNARSGMHSLSMLIL